MRGDKRERMRHGGREKRMTEISEDVAVTPQMYQKLTERLAGKPEERILTYLMLRSLKQVRIPVDVGRRFHSMWAPDSV